MTLVPQWDIPARSCLVCGLDYWPRGTKQRYCDGCQPGVARIQSRNRMRAMRAKRAALVTRNAPVNERNEEYREAVEAFGGSYKLAEWRKRQDERRRNGLA